MLCMFVGERYRVIDVYLQTWARSFAPKMRVVDYESLPLYRDLQAATYLFTDLERLTSAECKRVEALADRIRAAGGRVMNEPSNVLRRYDLLRSLHGAGFNSYTVHRLDDKDAIRYPVFVRREREHNGPLTELLHTPEELQAGVAKVQGAGKHDNDLLIVEYEDTAGADGLYRKYSAMRIGDRIIPRHVLFGKTWVGKLLDVINDATVAEEDAYLAQNPHEVELRRIFEFAKIDYGRIDYAMRDGRIVTWEINTNPQLVSRPDKCGAKRLAGQAMSSAAITKEFESLAAGRDVRVAVAGLSPIVQSQPGHRKMFMLITRAWSELGRFKLGQLAAFHLRRSLNRAIDATQPGANER